MTPQGAHDDVTPVRIRKRDSSGDYGEVDSGESRQVTSDDLPSALFSGSFMSPAHHRSHPSPAQAARSRVSPAHARLPVPSACEEIQIRRPDSIDGVSEPDDRPSTSPTQCDSPVNSGRAPPATVDDEGTVESRG